MNDGLFTPDEIMLYADQFCSRMQAVAHRVMAQEDREELISKIGRARLILAVLQTAFDEDKLVMTNPEVREEFRGLLLELHWVAFYGRAVIDRAIFKKLIYVEAGLSRLFLDEVIRDSPPEAR